MGDDFNYDDFYRRANGSNAFARYCEEAFGIDLTQNGFTDRNQLDYLINFVHMNKRDVALDIGCGNGKIANYIAVKTDAAMWGLDKSNIAIDFARAQYGDTVGCSVQDINEMRLEGEKYTVALFLDSLHLSDDFRKTLEYAYEKLRDGGRIGIMHSDFNLDSDERACQCSVTNAEIAATIRQNGWRSNFVDFTDQHYRLMIKKNAACRKHRPLFEQEQNLCLYEKIEAESVGAETLRDKFASVSNRYAFCIYK